MLSQVSSPVTFMLDVMTMFFYLCVMLGLFLFAIWVVVWFADHFKEDHDEESCPPLPCTARLACAPTALRLGDRTGRP